MIIIKCKICKRHLINDKNRERLLKESICSDCVVNEKTERALKNYFSLRKIEFLKQDSTFTSYQTNKVLSAKNLKEEL